MWPEKLEGQVTLTALFIVAFLIGMILGFIFPLAVALPVGFVTGCAIGFFGSRAIMSAGWWYE